MSDWRIKYSEQGFKTVNIGLTSHLGFKSSILRLGLEVNNAFGLPY